MKPYAISSSWNHLVIFVIFLTIILIDEGISTEDFNLLSPEEFVAAELKAFELEREQFLQELQPKEHTRNKRTVLFNSEAPFDIGMLFGIPLSLVLPSLSNFFNWMKDDKKQKRSIPSFGRATEASFEEEYPLLQREVDRISLYLDLMKIPPDCYNRVICEFSANPSRYSFVSELILKRIEKQGAAYIHQQFSNSTSKFSKKSLLEEFWKALEIGIQHGHASCESKFGQECPFSVEKLLKMDVLDFWNILTQTLQFKINEI